MAKLSPNMENFELLKKKLDNKIRKFQTSEKLPSSKVYRDVISTKSESYYSYEDYNVPLTIISDIKVHRYINRGKYCEAYMGSTSDPSIISNLNSNFSPSTSIWFDSASRLTILLKCLKKIPIRKIQRESLILSNLSIQNHNKKDPKSEGDRKYIIPLLGVISSPVENDILDPIFVYPFINTKNINIHYLRHRLQSNEFSLKTIKRYIYCLSRALRACHTAGIMHRDVKPHNIAFDDKSDTFFLLDFGLAEFYHPCQNYTTRVASRHYKAPELLLGMEYYDYAIDIWGIGVIFAGFVLGKEPLFKETTDERMIYKVGCSLGSEEIRDFVKKYKLGDIFEKEMDRVNLKNITRKSWEEMDLNGGKYLNEDVKDLLDKLLKIDPAERISIDEVLENRIFDEVRDEDDKRSNSGMGTE